MKKRDFINGIGLVFDMDYYRGTNPELSAMPKNVLFRHAALYAEKQGRPISPLDMASKFIEFTNVAIKEAKLDALEIGPYDNPCLRGKSVKYFDVLNADDLRNRAIKQNRPYNRIPSKIDFVDSNGDLSAINSESFDIVFSSHCIEHQPDFVRHLKQISRLLRNDGLYVLKIPDKRYIFDYFLSESNIAEILDAYHENRKIHSFQSVLEHRMFVTHNEPYKHWLNEHGEMPVSKLRFENALNEFEESKGGYIDVHAWQFTPRCFYTLIWQLNLLGVSDFIPYRVSHTLWGSNEFTAVLKKKGADLCEVVIRDDIDGSLDDVFSINMNGINYIYMDGITVCRVFSMILRKLLQYGQMVLMFVVSR